MPCGVLGRGGLTPLGIFVGWLWFIQILDDERDAAVGGLKRIVFFADATANSQDIFPFVATEKRFGGFEKFSGAQELAEFVAQGNRTNADFDWIALLVANSGAHFRLAAVAQGGVQREVVALELAIFGANMLEEMFGHFDGRGLVG